MVLYRSNRVPGGTYFFTLTLCDRRSRLLTQHIDLLRDAFRSVRERHPFEIIAIVVLPEHLHAIWRLPPGDVDYPNRWRGIKRRFTEELLRLGHSCDRHATGEHAVWQRRYWEHTIRDDEDLRRHVDYIHINPVKHGLVDRVADWPYSSFNRYVREGRLPINWASELLEGGFGE